MAAAVLPAFAHAETIRIEIKGLAFSPAQVTAHVGDTVEWRNSDFVAHTATGRNQEWDVQIPPHQSGSTVLTQAGTIEYFCRVHPNMKGRIAVEAP